MFVKNEYLVHSTNFEKSGTDKSLFLCILSTLIFLTRCVLSYSLLKCLSLVVFSQNPKLFVLCLDFKWTPNIGFSKKPDSVLTKENLYQQINN